MRIELFTEPILLDIRQKSHLEVQDIKDPEARDNARAGLDKKDEIVRCMNEGFSQVTRRCMRFLEDNYTTVSNNANLLTPPTSYVYDFVFSERRGLNKADTLRDTMSTLVVQYALSRFYVSVNQGELSNRHSLLAVEAGNTLEQLLYTKQPPRV